ncbi:MAG TPA: MJ0042-type zinc finger domain-containing protein [Bryobacteraceae bacterium]|nr:MJ0042-type zinc finger domain-containing protein [Bryobacteraceae bacterium]
MKEKLKCKRCGTRFRQDNVDDALEAEELVCPRCGHLFTKADLGPRDWLHRPISAQKVDLWLGLALVVLALVINQPVVALFAAASILIGVLFAWLIGRARRNDAPISIIERKAPR